MYFLTFSRDFDMGSDPIGLLFLVVSSASFTFGVELQPDDADSGRFDNLDQGSTVCVRKCEEGQPPMVCYWKFHLEQYSVLSRACKKCPLVEADCISPQCVTADGFERSICTVNRKMPGPSIQVCKGDTVVVDVKNQMPGSSTSIHWHGIRQKLTPWMDGVPMVTQCPILEGQTFRYRFQADEPGTYFWHSHDGLQKADGVVGSLIVREPDAENIVRDYYDFDLPSHTVLVQDWMHTSANDKLPGFIHHNTRQSPQSYLINGRGIYLNLNSVSDLNRTVVGTPLAELHVNKGYRYLLRIVSGTCQTCPFRISFQYHQLTVIGADGHPIERVIVDSVVLSAGERFDVVLETKQPAAAYWIRVEGVGQCSNAVQLAVLRYNGSSVRKPLMPPWSNRTHSSKSGFTLNPRNVECNNKTLSEGICVSQLRNRQPNPPQLAGPPDVQMFLAFGFYLYTDEELFQSGKYPMYFVPRVGVQQAGFINNISYSTPPSPLLTQLEDIPKSKFCQEAVCNHTTTVCGCTNVIKVPLGSVVELILYDVGPPIPDRVSHPFHIHGHDFYVLEQGSLSRQAFDQSLQILKSRLTKCDRAISSFLPRKDTVAIPADGFSVLRIVADNPGFWLLHCHFAYHLESGMTAVIQVGEPCDLPPIPNNIPRCNEFLPPLKD